MKVLYLCNRHGKRQQSGTAAVDGRALIARLFQSLAESALRAPLTERISPILQSMQSSLSEQ